MRAARGHKLVVQRAGGHKLLAILVGAKETARWHDVVRGPSKEFEFGRVLAAYALGSPAFHVPETLLVRDLRVEGLYLLLLELGIGLGLLVARRVQAEAVGDPSGIGAFNRVAKTLNGADNLVLQVPFVVWKTEDE
jgi:hypothetical protein